MSIINVLLPILLCTLIGSVSGRFLSLDLNTLSRIVLYVLGPCLTFSLLINIELTFDQMMEIISFTVLHLVLGILILLFIFKFTHVAHEKRTSAILCAVFMNSANYGLPVILYAFGQQGMERAIIFVVVQLVLFNTLGIFWGAQASVNKLIALKRILFLPTTYAVLLAYIFRVTGFPFPEIFISVTDLLGQGAIPVMLILLGAQLSVKVKVEHFRLVAFVSAYRLILSPILAHFLLFLIFNIDDQLSYKVLMLQAAMPTAITNMLLAMEFEGNPELVSSLILVTTLASFITLSVIMKILV